jgi:nucleotidyltransferase/DNA polymerase involved in DNA repair
MRIGCLFFARFAVQVESRANSALAGQPVIIGGLPHEPGAVYDASEEAMRCGVKPGMPLRQAYALCPRGMFLPLAGEKYSDAFSQILRLLGDYSPVVEMAARDCAFLDITREHDERRFIAELEGTIKREACFRMSAGAASAKFVAWAASQLAGPGGPVIVPDGEEREFLQDLPVDWLPASSELLRRLKLFGIYRMGQLAKLPRQAVSLQFGAEGQKLWDLAGGIDGSRLTPGRMPETIKEELSFEPPAEDLALILSGADGLLDWLSWQLKQRWQCCRQLTASLTFINGHVVQRTFHFKEATTSREIMLRQLKGCLEKARFTAPAGELRLTLTGLCPEEAKQASFLSRMSKRRERLKPAIDWLQQRYGRGVIKKAIPEEQSILPEDSFSFTQFDSGEG